jgi:hypothetical protein
MQYTEVANELGTLETLTAPTDIGKEKALSLRGQFLDESHYTLLLDKGGVVLTPDGQVLCILLKDRLRPELLDAARPIVRKVACQPVAGGNRADAAGTGMVQRKRKSGSVSKLTGVPCLVDLSDEDYQRLKPAKGGIIGYHPRVVRGGQIYPSRLTAYKGVLPSELSLMAELEKEVAEALRLSFVQDRWATQFKKASQTPPAFLLKTRDSHAPRTTITCNKSWRTAAHVDGGVLKESFGVMCCFGEFDGCDLVFPRYQTAVRYREGDVILANSANEVHGNTPLLNPDGTVPEPGKLPERLVCVFYFEQNTDAGRDAQ